MNSNSSNQRGYTRKRRLLLRKRLKSYPSEENGTRNSSAENSSVENSSYRPEWKGAIEGYSVKFIHKNYWRFQDYMGFDDAYQEAYVKFLEMVIKYGDNINSPSWFMALYKVALQNKITDLAKQANRQRRQVCFAELDDQISSGNGEPTSYQECLVGSLESDGVLETLLDDAPEHVRQVLTLMSTNNPTLLSAMAQTWYNRGKRIEGGNQFLCKMLGYDPRRVDLVESVREYLEEVDEE